MTFRIFPPLLLAQAAFSSLSASTMSNINGGMGRGGRSALSSVDFYRRVPKDLTEVRVIDFLSCWFCDPSNTSSKQEPATARGHIHARWSNSVGHVRRILVQNGIPAGNLMDLGWGYHCAGNAKRNAIGTQGVLVCLHLGSLPKSQKEHIC